MGSGDSKLTVSSNLSESRRRFKTGCLAFLPIRNC